MCFSELKTKSDCVEGLLLLDPEGSGGGVMVDESTAGYRSG